MTATGLWLRLSAGSAAALGSVLLIPVPAPTNGTTLSTAAVAGAVAGVALFGALARSAPRAVLGGWSRRDSTRSSFFVLWAGVEEALWRRLVLGGVALHAGWPAGLVVSTVGFAMCHRLGRSSHFLTGCAFGTIYLVTGRLLAAIVTHAIYNLLLDRALQRPVPVTAP
ncbi:MAG TPA: CPBP family intramembrane glutamic endopeptidase [Gaiellaceae bacterium]|nr:CPBP family intramembrane glutamic endopeptidase [Gaiellaceae bacterium]